MRFRVGSATHTGQVRSDNEDSNLVGHDLFAVADGMGGHQGGAVASALAVQILEANANDPSLASLKDGVQIANHAVYDAAGTDDALRGMGTTLCAIRAVDTPEGPRLAWVNVGDSRVYIFRDDTLTKLSHDHSLVEDLVRDGRLTPDQAAVHPQRNIITRALGIDDRVEVDGEDMVAFEGDRYLLCSDGLFNELDEHAIGDVLRRLPDPGEAADELVRLANDHGGRDNITAVVVEVVDDGGPSASASAALADEPTTAHGRASIPAPSSPAESPDPVATASAARDGGPTGGRGDEFYADLDRARTRHFTWRVAAFMVLLLLVFGAAAGAVGWYARRTYFVGFRADQVTIFKGRPGGVLWFEPTVDQRVQISRAEVPPARRHELEVGRDQATLADAREYVVNLRQQIDKVKATTTTTSPPVTTPSVPAPGAPTSTTAPLPRVVPLPGVAPPSTATAGAPPTPAAAP